MESRPRLLLLTQDFPPRPGGMSRYYDDLASGWGDTCTVLCGAWKDRAPVGGGAATVRTIQGIAAESAHRGPAVRRAVALLREELATTPPALVLAGNLRPYALPVAGAAGTTPWGFVIHGTDLLRTARRWRRHPLKAHRWRRLRHASVIVTNSAYTAGEAARLGLPADRMVVVPPEVDTHRFRPAVDADEQRAERVHLGLDPEGCLALFVGRLVDRKGLEELFAALARIPAARLAVVGSDPADPWRERAHAHGVADRVHFGGAPDDTTLPRWYRAADLFVGPSRGPTADDEVEGFGIVFLEAQASGIPVIATRTGGIPEAVAHGESGILVAPDAVDPLVDAWQDLLEDEPLRRRMGAAGPVGRARDHGPGTSAERLARAIMELPETPSR